VLPSPPLLLLLFTFAQAPLGDSGGLDVLAARYGHDAKALDQVGFVSRFEWSL
jgi:hypothetical protein